MLTKKLANILELKLACLYLYIFILEYIYRDSDFFKIVLLFIYATTGITAGVACGIGDAHSSGSPDLTPSLLGGCDIRLVFDLMLYLCHSYFIILSIDYGLWNEKHLQYI